MCNKRRIPLWVVLISSSILLHPQASAQQQPSAVPANQAEPFDVVNGRKVASKRPADIKQGHAMFRAFCSRCHGRDGEGSKGPSLIDGRFRRVKNDEQIVEIITNGITGTGMAGFGPGYEDLYWQVTAYLRDAERAAEQPKLVGNVNRGYELFKKHQCANCHWTGKEGGRLGTDLSRLAATQDYVHQSLLDPDSQIDGSYQRLLFVLPNGTTISGRRLHEDTHYITVMTNDEQLKTIEKDAAATIDRPPQSWMPSYKQQLTPADLQDLTAYLFSLQKSIEQ